MTPILFWMRGAAGAARPRALVRMLFILCVTATASAHARPSLTISGTPATSVTAAKNYAFTPTIMDSRSRPVVFAIANKPSWALFSSTTGTLSGTPTTANAGTYPNIVIAVSDGMLTATLPAFSVQVIAPTLSSTSVTTAPPVISGTPPTTDVAGSTYAFQPTASDPSGLTLSFSVQNKPAWATFSIASGLLSGTPTSTQAGVYANVIISASDGQQSSALPAFSITVTSPTSSGGTALLSLTPPSANTDGSTLTDLAGYNIYYGTSPSNLSQLAQLSGSTTTSYTVSNLASGTWYFGATAYTTTGVESALSSIGSKTIP